MPEERTALATLDLSKPTSPPLVFISHDSRDADLAEAFSNLLKCVSAGMLKSFRSSDKKGAEGIEFGDEWYKTLMTKLDSASDVVCLITERSVNRPWILYEAGVAKGKMDTPVHGLALGVPLSRAGVGPFYQFQNSDDSDESLSKLVIQLCRRIPGLEPDSDVVRAQIQAFKVAEAEALKAMGEPKSQDKKAVAEEGAAAKVLEEMKLVVRELPVQIEQRLADFPGRLSQRKIRRIHPEMFMDMASAFDSEVEPGTGLLMICSFLRDDFPWLYEFGIDAYRTMRSGSPAERQESLKRLIEACRITFRGPWLEIFGSGREALMAYRELPMILEEYSHRLLHRPIRKRGKADASGILDSLE
jgi:hypothetical protein